MNGLNSDVCYNILSLLQNNVCPVENVCNICGASHYTQNCPDFSVGEHVKDATPQNMSRSSIPSGLHIIETQEGTCVVTSQKFAKGSRFGPMLAERSYSPIESMKFPLIIFGNPRFGINDPELEHLFKERNIYLDTTNEHKCNWMIHVPHAKYSNEQNLICFQLHNQIYYTAINDIDVGDILKVWYAPKYAAKMNTRLLSSSPYEIVNNVLRQVSMDTLDSFVEDSISQQIISTEVSLPPINSLMKTTASLNFYPNNNYIYGDYHHGNYEVDSFGKYYEESTDINMNVLSHHNPSTNGGGTTTSAAGELVDDVDLNNLSMNSDLMNFTMDGQHGSTNAGDLSATGDEERGMAGVDVEETSTGTKKKKSSMKIVQNSRLKPAVYSCNICNKTYVAICNLNKHHMQVHQLQLCNLCMKTFKSMESLKIHVCPNQTFDSECSKCPICYKVLANPWSLARHVKCTHKGYTISVKKKEIFLEEIDPTANELSLTSIPISISEQPSENDATIEDSDFKESPDICSTTTTSMNSNNFYDMNNSCQPTSLTQPPAGLAVIENTTATITAAATIISSPDNSASNEKITIKFENISDDDIPPLVQIKPKLKEPVKKLHNASPMKAAIARALVSKLTKKSLKRNADTRGGDGGGSGDGCCFSEDENGTVVATAAGGGPKPKATKKTKETTIRTHKCDECGKMYAKKDGLQKHKLTHENRSYFCPFCAHTPVKSNDSLRRHFRTNHPELQNRWCVKGFINSCAVMKTEEPSTNTSIVTTTTSMVAVTTPDDMQPSSTDLMMVDEHLMKQEFDDMSPECWSPKLIFNDNTNAVYDPSTTASPLHQQQTTSHNTHHSVQPFTSHVIEDYENLITVSKSHIQQTPLNVTTNSTWNHHQLHHLEQQQQQQQQQLHQDFDDLNENLSNNNLMQQQQPHQQQQFCDYKSAKKLQNSSSPSSSSSQQSSSNSTSASFINLDNCNFINSNPTSSSIINEYQHQHHVQLPSSLIETSSSSSSVSVHSNHHNGGGSGGHQNDYHNHHLQQQQNHQHHHSQQHNDNCLIGMDGTSGRNDGDDGGNILLANCLATDENDDLENIVETSTKFLAVFLNDANLTNDKLMEGVINGENDAILN